MALFLPRWATDCLRRADRFVAGLPDGTPLALWEKQRGAMVLTEVDTAAAGRGLFVGQSLSDARAIAPDLVVHEIDRSLIEHLFHRFADWHSYASPIVAVETNAAAYGDLVLDITGVSHLFGGEAAMLARVTDRIGELGIAVRGAVAGSVGAAWALAHYAPGQVVGDDARAALAGLPVAGLRLDDTQVAGLNQMGLKRIGQLFGRPRQPLMARFGAGLLLRLDQALGEIEERVRPRIPVAERYVERRFAEPLGLIDDVLMCARDLALQLTPMLEREGMGAQSFHLFLYRVDHEVMTLTVNAARATRDPEHVLRLIANRAERLIAEYDPGFGIDMIRLAVSSLSKLDPVQAGVFESGDVTAELDRLYDRIASRFGPLSVVRTKFVNSHIPERAALLEPVIARTPDDPLAEPDPAARRPLRLLAEPEPIAVWAEAPDGPPSTMSWRRASYRFVKASGPERIGVEWWWLKQRIPAARRDDPDLPAAAFIDEEALTRDYFVVEDAEGRCFWVFRLGLYGAGREPQWFMHGLFA